MTDGTTAPETYDCIVVGSGPGGYVTAIRAAQLGLRTAIVERTESLGGRCLHWACIPAKTVLRSADILSEIGAAADFGIELSQATVNFGAIARRRDDVIATLAQGVRGLLRKNAVEVVHGAGALAGGARVQVGSRTLVATRAVVLATGSTRRPLPDISFGGHVVGTEEAWAFDGLPASLAVIGAGASGTEIASAYARLGTQVRLFEHFDRVLPSEDGEVSTVVRRGLEAQGVQVMTSARIADVESHEGGVRLRANDVAVEAEWLVIATGRAPDTDALGLAGAGIDLTGSGHVAVDPAMRTSASAIFAIGDLTAGPALAHKASEEGIIAAEAAAGLPTTPLVYEDIPRATFSSPSVGSVGLTEEAARSAGHEVAVGRARYRSVGAGAVSGSEGLVKIVGDRTYGAILGAHVVGTRATDLIQSLVNLRALEGGYPELARITHPHPTLSEAILEAARDADGWLVHG